MKKRKIEETLKSKNKRGWFGFLYQAAQLDLTDEDFKAIEAEVLQLIN